jgi:uncharacterized protein
MKIELDTHDAALNIIKSYSRDGVIIKNTLYQNSIIVSPDTVIEDWAPAAFSDLAVSHFSGIIKLSPEIVLIGTGERIRFPDGSILDAMLTRHIGVEVMDTGAACRAYNFLAGEGRVVFAALLQPAA